MPRVLCWQQRRPDLSIELNNGNDYSKHSYSTHDVVEGKVVLHFHEDTVIDSVSISFRGQCTSVVTDLQPWARERPSTKTTHTFLVMQQPIEHQKLPPNRIAKARSMHSIPFCFTIPALLLSDACKHGLEQESPVSQAHRLLPPSLGTPESSKHVKDLASENARVEYYVHTSLSTRSSRDGSIQSVEKGTPIRVEPIFEPSPPFVIEKDDPNYQLYGAADLCWRVLRPSSSDRRLLVHTAQPPPVQISRGINLNSPSTSPSTSTHVTTNLEFFPEKSLSSPPRLESVKIGLRVFTYSAAVPFLETPRSSTHSEPTNLYNTFSKLIDLGHHSVGDLVWGSVLKMRHQSRRENV